MVKSWLVCIRGRSPGHLREILISSMEGTHNKAVVMGVHDGTEYHILNVLNMHYYYYNFSKLMSIFKTKSLWFDLELFLASPH